MLGMAVTKETTYINQRFKQAAFYVEGEQKRFENGTYVATTSAEKTVLDKLPYTVAQKASSEVKE